MPVLRLAASVSAAMAIVAVATALARRHLAGRTVRRELERYLQWLLDDALQAVGTYHAPPWPSWRPTT